jgi:hypothetical protein
VINSVVSFVVLTSLTCISLALYLLPCLIGYARRAPDLAVIAVINILLGWTFIGWVVALALAFRSAPPGPPPPTAGGAGWAQQSGPPALRPGSPPPLNIPPRRPAGQEDADHAL